MIFKKVAGVDVGASSNFVAIPLELCSKPGDNIQEFPSHTSGVIEMSKWLKANGIEAVAMEATGIYWQPIYNQLESDGFEVCVVNPRAVKRPPGRKSDVHDCQWIQKTFSLGLLSPSFIPPADIIILRGYARNRSRLIADNARNINQMDKALRQMNIQLDRAVTDIVSATGRLIIEEIIKGERNPLTLAKLRDPLCRNSIFDVLVKTPF
ncbi:MAG: transposase [Deltaproteobacteria bacterium]|nr:transposase [Deltaproteobacteria bacterium]